jgi:hypothetical protein
MLARQAFYNVSYATYAVLFALVILGIGSCFMTGMTWTVMFLFLLALELDDRCMLTRPAFIG